MREKEASIRGTVIREMIARFTSDNLIGRKFKNGEIRKNLSEPQWNCPQGYQMVNIPMEHFKMEWLTCEKGNSDKVILQLHGGGYIGAMRNVYRTFAVLYSELSGGMSVMTPDYRVAPENPYPAALEDAKASYDWLRGQGYAPEQIFFAGDSAGGGLAMALCMYLRDHGEGIPCGIIAMSPWTDLTSSGETYDTNYERDPLFGKTRDSLIYNQDYVGLEDPTDPYISPLFGSFKDFPPMLLQVGSYEMLLSDSMEAAKKAKQEGVKVKLSIYEGMFHVFQMAMRLIPESKQAWKEVAKFIGIVESGRQMQGSVRTHKQHK